MPAATGTYRMWGPYLRDYMKGLIAPEDADRFSAILTTSGFVPDFDADQRLTHALPYETFEGDWPQGGLPLTNVVISLDTATDRIALMHDPLLADEVTLPQPGARLVVYDDTGATDADKRLAFSMPISPALTPIGGPIAHASPNGIVRSSY